MADTLAVDLHTRSIGPCESKHRVEAGSAAAEVEHVSPGRELEMVVRARPFLVARVKFEVLGQDRRSCRLRLSEAPLGSHRLLSWLIGPLIKARNVRFLDRLAGYVAVAADTS